MSPDIIMEMISHVHFLRYDQCCEFDIMYGYTDFSFAISEDHKTLYILQSDLRMNSKLDLTFPIPQPFFDIKTTLTHILVELMSHPSNFYGRPEYVASDFFSESEFEQMLERSLSIIKDREILAIELAKLNELIQYCLQANLDPELEGSSPTNWKAKCASGEQHFMLISTKSNQWVCGYCKRKGDLMELKRWVRERKNFN